MSGDKGSGVFSEDPDVGSPTRKRGSPALIVVFPRLRVGFPTLEQQRLHWCRRRGTSRRRRGR